MPHFHRPSSRATPHLRHPEYCRSRSHLIWAVWPAISLPLQQARSDQQLGVMIETVWYSTAPADKNSLGRLNWPITCTVCQMSANIMGLRKIAPKISSLTSHLTRNLSSKYFLNILNYCLSSKNIAHMLFGSESHLCSQWTQQNIFLTDIIRPVIKFCYTLTPAKTTHFSPLSNGSRHIWDMLNIMHQACFSSCLFIWFNWWEVLLVECSNTAKSDYCKIM